MIGEAIKRTKEKLQKVKKQRGPSAVNASAMGCLQDLFGRLHQCG